jgi:hypothetical protein
MHFLTEVLRRILEIYTTSRLVTISPTDAQYAMNCSEKVGSLLSVVKGQPIYTGYNKTASLTEVLRKSWQHS